MSMGHSPPEVGPEGGKKGSTIIRWFPRESGVTRNFRQPEAPADPVAGQVSLAGGETLNQLMVQIANSTESQADMASTYAAEGVFAPETTEFAGFASAMSTSYGAPMELVAVDPYSGAQTELANTSITDPLAELPALETQAGGMNLDLQLADGTQVTFDNTGRLADFLYAVAVQLGQATSFITDNYNLDMQWLNTVGQPLLNEAVGWSEQSATFAAAASAVQGLTTPAPAIAAFIAAHE